MPYSKVPVKKVCDKCGEPFEISKKMENHRTKHSLPNYCGKCMRAFSGTMSATKREETMLERYGVTNAMQIDEFRERQSDSVEAKFGVRNVSKLQEIKDLKREKSLAEFGTKCTLQAPEVRKKVVNTWKTNLGVDNPSKAESVKMKKAETRRRTGNR